MSQQSEIGRKYLAHPPIIERHNEPVIIYLTVCRQDRKCIFALPDSAAVIVDAWQKANAWLVGRYVDYARSHPSFLRAKHISDEAAAAMGEILEESCLSKLAAPEQSSALAARFLGHAIAASRKLRFQMGIRDQ
jgi:hypothetical protein